MRRTSTIASSLALLAALSSPHVLAAPSLRHKVDQHGDFVFFGNTLGFECAQNVTIPAPFPGSTATCPSLPVPQQGQLNDTAPDLFWRADSPVIGQAEATSAITAALARSTAVLSLPPGATVTYARIYWAGLLAAPMSTDTSLRIEKPSGSLNQVVAQDVGYFVNRNGGAWYQSSADITELLVQHGDGAYRISEVDSVELSGLDNDDPMVGWVAVVFYTLPSDPLRNLALFDGLDLVPNGGSTQVVIDGFVVPNAGFDAKLGVVAYEGEQQYGGDALSFNGTALGNDVNPANNFFNSSRSYLGAAVSNAGDLPRLSGGAGSMAGMDVDVVNVAPQLSQGDTSATVVASSSGDTYLLGAFVTSIATFKPDFATSGKTFTDVDGAPLLPGDTLEYSITVTNTGNDASANTVMTDPLPLGVTYVPGSISITAGPNTGGPFTDAAGDDVAEYDAATRTVRVRLGTGASANAGGSLAIGQTTTIKFRVTVDATANGSILNQAIITAEGAQGAPADDFPTDGNGDGSGVPPTEVIVDACATNAECAAPTPVCDTAPNPNVCVQCVVDADCSSPLSPQCLPDQTCGCVVGCDDSDGDGLSDATEDAIGTDKNDADSDDDGVKDGDEPSPFEDTDGDGLINALDPDSDNDGLYDGTELGLGCDGEGTAPGSQHCIPDGDAGATVTDPLNPDTDGGGVRDGSEDVNHDGVKDANETDPTVGHGDDDATLVDSDGDGLSDAEEVAIGTDPMDADSDDDGVIDGDEVNPSDDADGDGLINALDPDSDNDGLYDGTELGLDCSDAATDLSKNHCKADADPTTVTNPVNADTDGGGVSDGNEDQNLDGKVDAGETDPTLGHGADDGSLDDDDGDGLSNGLEETLGTDPQDADSDDDGVPDGEEPNFADDTDGDGLINALDPDSDDDGLYDGTELGLGCDAADTDAAAGQCVPDADGGATTTNPLDADTDGGGVSDGDEDTNHDGKVDAGETDPNDAADDDSGPSGEGGAGGEGAGGAPVAGSAGAPVTAGNGGVMSGGSAGGGGVISGGTDQGGSAGSQGVGNSASVDGILEGGGCACRTAAPASGQAPLAALVSILGLLGVAVARRRSRG